MNPVLQFLELVKRELHADDARAELGGREPGADVVWAPLRDGFRVVALFNAAPTDPEEKRSRLRALIEAFEDVAQPAPDPLPASPAARQRAARAALDEALALTAGRARAKLAVVLDTMSPELWGASASGVSMSEERMQHALTLAHAPPVANDERSVPVGAVERGGELYLVRPIAGIYRLVLIFAEGWSPLHAEATLLKALPVLENRIAALPPRNPPGGGKQRRRLRSV